MIIKICPNAICGDYNKLIISHRMSYCSKCGTALTTTINFPKCAICGAFVFASDAYCSCCGTVIPATTAFKDATGNPCYVIKENEWYPLLQSVTYYAKLLKTHIG